MNKIWKWMALPQYSCLEIAIYLIIINIVSGLIKWWGI